MKERQKPDIFMPIYIGDYLGDTMALDAEAHGAYFLLLMAAWRSEGRLPSDRHQLAAIAKVRPKRWPQVWGLIARYFDVDGDSLIQRRLTRELNKAVGRIEAASEGGKRGANKRWGANHKASSQAMGNPLGTHPETGGSQHATSPSPSQSEIPSEGDPPFPPRNSRPALHSAYRPARLATVTPAFLAVYERYPNGEGRLEAAQVFQDLSDEFPGGEAALSQAILESFGSGKLDGPQYDNEPRYRLTLRKFLEGRRWEDKAPAARGAATKRDPILDASIAARGGAPYLPPG